MFGSVARVLRRVPRELGGVAKVLGRVPKVLGSVTKVLEMGHRFWEVELRCWEGFSG